MARAKPRGTKSAAPLSGGDPAESRVAPRHALLILAAKLVVNNAEYLCLLRDASDTGISLQMFHEIPDGTEMILELQSEEHHRVEPVWREGRRMGMRFSQPIDVQRLIEMPAPFERRPIRVRTCVTAAIGTPLGDNAMCTILDLSQHGAKVACGHSFALDQRVRLVASGMPTVSAKIRWRKDEMLGLAFETTFPLSELANIVAGFHAAPSPANVSMSAPLPG